ncbi:MAG: DUF1624 domain-containing protein [Lachnospiraceae bacterium]|nr:DUF1624 domain-containing protein [Lachnospiraceae bacterium]
MEAGENKTKRYDLIDTLRGMEVISMILFHACWIMNHFGILVSTETLYGPTFTVWERSICIGFIIIAGFSFSYGHHHVRSGLVLFGIGLLITVVTVIFLPEIKIVFGILTFLGTATLIMIPIDKVIKGALSWSRGLTSTVLLICFVLFLVSYDINKGYLGLTFAPLVTLPQYLYRGYAATFIGFMEQGFFSTDYFSILPWIFMYFCGYFLHKLIRGTSLEETVLTRGLPGIRAIGRHSLPIYVIHPVILYVLIYLSR